MPWKPRRKAVVAADARRRLRAIGVIRSTLKALSKAPKQGHEGGPDAWLEVRPSFVDGLAGIAVGDQIIVVTWLHKARRDILKVHPRDNRRVPLTGVFATRSQDRPNPLGFHPVTVKRIVANRLRVGPIEAIDRTPVVDIKPALGGRSPQARPLRRTARPNSQWPRGHR
jgi:tRNA-Thr(GGU) m(6)t(6)A37 methyltransferase TsaA